MKRVTAFFTALVLLVSLTACGGPSQSENAGSGEGPSPGDTVATFLDAVKAQDPEAMKAVYDGEFDIFDITDGEKDIEIDVIDDEAGKELYDKIVSKILDFDYEIMSDEVEEDKAKVQVKLTTYDLGGACYEAIKSFISQAVKLALNGASEEEMDQIMLDQISLKLDEETEKDKTFTVVFHLTKVDDGWVVNTIGNESDIKDALTGGLINSFKKISDMYND